VIVPADAIETGKAIETAVETEGPFYIRLGRPKVRSSFPKIIILGWEKPSYAAGKDVTIIAIGIMVKAALDAAAELQKQGIDCSVINLSTLKPADEAAIVQAAANTGAIVTAEEHLEHGGLASVVSQVIVKNHPVPMEFVAMKGYAMSGKPHELLERYGLTSRGIQEAVIKVLERN